jgi:Domain of unknown function (DUF4398)
MPQQSIDAAKTAVAAAQNAKAGQYASAEFNQAESLLKNAISQQQMKNDFQAKAFANQAKGKAEAALRIAQQKASTPPAATGPQAPATTPPKPTTQTPPPPPAGTQKPKGNKK